MSTVARVFRPPRLDSATLARARALTAYRGVTRRDAAMIGGAAALLGTIAAVIAVRADYVYGYGDASSHVYIARRVVDSSTPGFAQLGTGWLPGVHLLMQPFVHFQPLLTSGLAGFMVSGPAFIVAAIAIADTAMVLSGRRVAGFVAAAVIVTNPSLLYLQVAPMMEPTMIAVLAVAASLLARWLRDEGVGTFLWLAVTLAAGTMVRYEGWILLPAATLIVMMWTLSRDTRDTVRPEALASAIAAPGAMLIMLYLFYNWLIFGSPFEFSFGEFSARAIGAGGSESAGTLDNLPMSTLAYGSATWLIAGVVTTAVALLSVIVLTFVWRPGRWLLVLLLLFSPYVFNVLVIYEGTSVIVTPIIADTFFNVRYGTLMLPAIALAIGLLAAFPPTRFRRRIATGAVVSLLVLQLGLFAVDGSANITTVRDTGLAAIPEHQTPAAIRESAQLWKEAYDGGKVLVGLSAPDLAHLQFFMNVAGVGHSNYVTADNNVVWDRALEDPARRVRWMIDASQRLGRPSIIQDILRVNFDAVTRFEIAYEDIDAGLRFYKLKPEFDTGG